MLRAEPDVGVGGQVEDEVAAGHGAGQGVRVEHVAAHTRVKPGSRCGLLQETLLTGREVVVGDDLVAQPQQPIDEVAADEAGAAGDEEPHFRLTSEKRTGRFCRPIRPAVEVIAVERPRDPQGIVHGKESVPP